MQSIVEIGKPVVGYEGYYEVSNQGRVRSLDRIVDNNGGEDPRKGVVLKGALCRGYPTVGVCVNGKTKTLRVNRVVAEAFIPNPDNLPQVNHKDENKLNNNVENLEGCTAKYNNRYSFAKHTKLTDIETGKEFVFETTTDAAVFAKVDPSNISRAVSMNRITGGKYAVEYVTNFNSD